MKPTDAVSAFDFQSLASLKHDARTQDPAALKEAAKQFESLFTQMLLKSMREANKSFGDSMFGGEQGEFYQDMFDDQMAVHLSQGKGLGLADMLIRQLTQGSPLPNPPPSNGGGDNESLRSAFAPSASQLPPPVAGGGQGGGVAFTSRADFIRQMLPHAKRAAADLGVDPHALLAQAALETGWGKHMPTNASGESSFNLFGIKAGSRWSGATVNVPTLEFEEGVAVRKVETFRAYESPADSFMDYARLIASSPRYENARTAGADVATFAAALQQGGYATDPNYANKIVRVADEVRRLTSDPLKFASAKPITRGDV